MCFLQKISGIYDIIVKKSITGNFQKHFLFKRYNCEYWLQKSIVVVFPLILSLNTQFCLVIPLVALLQMLHSPDGVREALTCSWTLSTMAHTGLHSSAGRSWMFTNWMVETQDCFIIVTGLVLALIHSLACVFGCTRRLLSAVNKYTAIFSTLNMRDQLQK